MDEPVIRRLQELRPALKRRWEELLRAEPVSSPLANPDTLIYLMDQTLDQLLSLLRTRSLSAWMRHHKAQSLVAQAGCACGLNPLLAYFSTGSRALLEVAIELGPELNEVLLFFHGLAQREMDALCGACCPPTNRPCLQRDFAAGMAPGPQPPGHSAP